MKCYSYGFNIPYGSGQGIVFAENENEAKKLIIENDGYYQENLKYETSHKIDLTEIILLENSCISFSYEE